MDHGSAHLGLSLHTSLKSGQGTASLCIPDNFLIWRIVSLAQMHPNYAHSVLEWAKNNDYYKLGIQPDGFTTGHLQRATPVFFTDYELNQTRIAFVAPRCWIFRIERISSRWFLSNLARNFGTPDWRLKRQHRHFAAEDRAVNLFIKLMQYLNPWLLLTIKTVRSS